MQNSKGQNQQKLEKDLKQCQRDKCIVSISKPRSRWMNRELISFEMRISDDMTTNDKVHKMECSSKWAEDKNGNSIGKGILKKNCDL